MSLFVTGTDTGIGKTVVAALILARYGRETPLVYWKPIATGARDGRDRERVAELVPRATTAAEAYLFADPVSPHLAAAREGLPIEIARIVGRYAELAVAHPEHRFVVEGVGGLLVPLDDAGTMMVDLVAALALPVLLVARSSLGTINHALLSLAELRRRALPVAGVVMVGPADADHRAAIERLGGVEVIAEVPRLESVDPSSIAEAARDFDPGGELQAWLVPPS
ncbi:MAG: dethiobiotin synthase [Thermoanaerobaculia bacterium]